MNFVKIIFFLILSQALFAGKIDVNASKIKTEIDRVHFIGNAEIKLDGSSIYADRVSVYLDHKNEIRSFEAIGDVRFLIQDEAYFFKGRANKISFDIFTQQYIMKGLAVIEDNNFLMKRYIAGEEIILDLFTDNLEVVGGSMSTQFFIKVHDVGSFFGI